MIIKLIKKTTTKKYNNKVRDIKNHLIYFLKKCKDSWLNGQVC